MRANWRREVLQETIEKYGTLEILNTDLGSQYTSEVHTNILLNNGIKISLDGKGRAIDNILSKDYVEQSNTKTYIYKATKTA